MRYKLTTVRSFERVFKKLPPAVQTHVRGKAFTLEDNPRCGSRLTGVFRGLWSLHTRFQDTDYRVLYEIDDRQCEVTLLYTSSRENFYREIGRLRLKAA
jgi:mRNA-degrading endonuclease RelE of RelBE toxin-antitoxin system